MVGVGTYQNAGPATVSVIIPTYDRAEQLVAAVNSCLAQTHPVHEVLVCDDGSTDDSELRIKALGDARVKWLPGQRAGRPAIPRNRGIAAATGDWLAFLDSDDVWLPNKLEVQFERIARTGALASCTNAERIRPGQGAIGPYFEDEDATFTLMDLLPVNRIICSSVLVRHELVSKAGGFHEARELRALEDYALWLRLCAYTTFDYCATPLLRYTDLPTSSVRSEAVPLDVQRDAVLSSLISWDRYQRFTRAQRKAIVRNLRAARRGAGRPFYDWMLIR